MLKLKKTILLSFILLINSSLHAQSISYSSAEIEQRLNKLSVLGSVLYIAAHPDDENTRVLSFMSRGRLLNTAYLSLTRGDGGQNLLGSEQGVLLGVIRTQELLAARNLDGAQQFFTRAIDFGYSKSAQETLEKWGRNIILGDIVKVIRQFQPDVILTRFSPTQGGHGHHLASAILAVEAFSAAADANQFPEQLDHLRPWQAKRIMWNTWQPGSDAVSIDVGEYNPVIGKSYTEIAAAGRSMHKSQGFGSASGRGSVLENFSLLAGDSVENDIFDGVDISWNRIAGSEKIRQLLNQARSEFDPEKPHKIILFLTELYRQVSIISDQKWADVKKQEIKELLRLCSGLWLESVVWEAGISQGMSIDVRTTAVKRLDIPVILDKIEVTFAKKDSVIDKNLDLYKPLTVKQTVTVPGDASYSQPFWLLKPDNGNIFTFPGDEYIGLAQNAPALISQLSVKIYDQPVTFNIPVKYRWTDAVKGEQFRPFVIRPEISVKIENPTYVFAAEKAQIIKVDVESTIPEMTGVVSIDLPAGWHKTPDSYPLKMTKSGERLTFDFHVNPESSASNGEVVAKVTSQGKSFNHQIIEIGYDHIPVQMVLQKAISRLVRLDIKTVPRTIGYIMGSGDDIPGSLMQLGYPVDLLSDDALVNGDLSVYDVIICGVRAFNTRETLGIEQQRLIDYVAGGGTWIVQHNTRFGFQVEQKGPYPFQVTGRDRISQEDAPMQILMSEHPVLNFPNKITTDDFSGWVQERGLYFADSWQGKLYPLLAGNDTGEPSKLGGLLYASYGKGVFIYTAFSWFRQLPAGVPGAYRIFVNIISAQGKS